MGTNISQNHRPEPSRVLWGLLVIAIGGLLLADRLELFHLQFSASVMWPFVLIALGLARVTQPRVARDGRCRSRRSAAWLLFIGFWGLLNNFHVFGLDYHRSWPLLVIFTGMIIVSRAMEPSTAPAPSGDAR
jgi:cell wall-active antibiotic response 4TMS protein YvqF